MIECFGDVSARHGYRHIVHSRQQRQFINVIVDMARSLYEWDIEARKARVGSVQVDAILGSVECNPEHRVFDAIAGGVKDADSERFAC